MGIEVVRYDRELSRWDYPRAHGAVVGPVKLVVSMSVVADGDDLKVVLDALTSIQSRFPKHIGFEHDNLSEVAGVGDTPAAVTSS